jgi:uncharacterized protein (AIM24 family)
MLKSISSWVQGGLFSVKLSGPGWISVTTHFDPLVIPIVKDIPVFTDPQNTVMWTSNLTPSLFFLIFF